MSVDEHSFVLSDDGLKLEGPDSVGGHAPAPCLGEFIDSLGKRHGSKISSQSALRKLREQAFKARNRSCDDRGSTGERLYDDVRETLEARRQQEPVGL